MLHPSASRGGASRRGARGFTLVELMTTVSIVGILAVVAYAGYHKFVVSSHQTEANHILAGIKNRQEAYRAETGSYLNVSPQLASNQGTNFTKTSAGSLYPHCMAPGAPAPGAFNVAWPVTACGACCNSGVDWLKLKVETTAPTFYGYTTVAGGIGTGPGTTSTVGVMINGATPNWPNVTTVNGPWFVATAVGDTDGNGIFSTVMLSSFDSEVYVDNDGE
jgi:type IV pilus assembly protein PilE